jgi:hypothetical protein
MYRVDFQIHAMRASQSISEATGEQSWYRKYLYKVAPRHGIKRKAGAPIVDADAGSGLEYMETVLLPGKQVRDVPGDHAVAYPAGAFVPCHIYG